MPTRRPAPAKRLTAVIDELYATPLSGFVAARNARAKELRATDDRDLSVMVAALPKPSAGAAAINALVRADPAALGPVSELSTRFRKAAVDADRDAIRSLSVERRRTVADVLDRMRASAEPARLSATATREAEQSLQAAIADAGALEALLSGRLLRTLVSDGLEPVDLDGAVAGESVRPSSKSAPSPRSSPSAADRRRERERATITKQLGSAERDRTRLDARDRELTDKTDELERRTVELQREFDELDRRSRRVEAERMQAQHDRDELESRIRTLQNRLREREWSREKEGTTMSLLDDDLVESARKEPFDYQHGTNVVRFSAVDIDPESNRFPAKAELEITMDGRVLGYVTAYHPDERGVVRAGDFGRVVPEKFHTLEGALEYLLPGVADGLAEPPTL